MNSGAHAEVQHWFDVVSVAIDDAKNLPTEDGSDDGYRFVAAPEFLMCIDFLTYSSSVKKGRAPSVRYRTWNGLGTQIIKL